MIPKECKRLAEVDFPIAEVSASAVREKSIRHGHPASLHQWWARRPLASSRAVLLSLLLPDPCDPQCPPGFKKAAHRLLSAIQSETGRSDSKLRESLLKFVGNFANGDLAKSGVYVEVARGLVKAAYGEAIPVVVDPFAGGGSIPLEALRLECDAIASDLNPVACTILKTVLEDIPRSRGALSDELRTAGALIQQRLEKELHWLYPRDANGAVPIAYIWARVVVCESPNCGAEIPLARTFWLCKKSDRKKALNYRVQRIPGMRPSVEFEIFDPSSEREVPKGSITRARATCLACGVVLSPERVRIQLSEQRGGADVIFDEKGDRTGGARLLAVATLAKGSQGRNYRLPTKADYDAINLSQKRLQRLLDDWERGGRRGLCPVPDEPLPLMSGTFNVPLYGITRWGDLFTARQKLALVTIARLCVESDQNTARLLAFCLDKLADLCNSGCNWEPIAECPRHLYTRQAIPMVWDFAEGAPLGNSSGSFAVILNTICSTLDTIGSFWRRGQVEMADAADHPLPDQTADVWFTDPPYYFAVPYADLSDFFFVWLKRALPDAQALLSQEPNNPLTPKERELCEMAHWDSVRYPHKDQSFFEIGMSRAFGEGRRLLREDGIGCVVFAHKTTEGWEALLSGLIRGGWTITGSWPIATEMGSRLRARDSAALATSVHLICRARGDDAGVGDWAQVLRELPPRVDDWMERLQDEGIRGADLVFACIGPALEIFSRYTRVETADGREVVLAEYLERVWEVVGRSALEHVLGTTEARARNGAAGAIEEDARLTALFLWTIQSTNGEIDASSVYDDEEGEPGADDDESGSASSTGKGLTLIYDVVRRFAQPLGINLEKWDARIIEMKKGIVRLLPVSERARQLFGADGAQQVAARLEDAIKDPNPLQGVLFPELETAPRAARKRAGATPNGRVPEQNLITANEATTLDRLHAAMLLQAGGRTNALRALLKSEQERGPDFFRLANALTALYPKASEEKRLLDAMLLAAPR